MKTFSGVTCKTLLAAVLGMVALAPAAAMAACPAVGASQLTGDCSPRSDYCFKWVVTGHEWMNGQRQYRAAIYQRMGHSNWVNTGNSFTAPCGSW